MSYIENTSISNANNVTINPSTDETVILLRRLIQVVNPLATQDTNQRQRVTLDASNVTLSTTVGSGTITTVTNLTGLGGGSGFSVDSRYHFIDQSRIAYATNIRANLKFT